MKFQKVGEKVGEFVDAHPKVTLALAGAAVALQALQLFESSSLFLQAFREAHYAEFAAGQARAASEALGG